MKIRNSRDSIIVDLKLSEEAEKLISRVENLSKVSNATQKPQVYYGLHMVEGVAEYTEPGQKPYRIFIGEKTIKNMDPTFAGCPIYVRHVDQVNLDKIQTEADGYVVESFFNATDGKHWAKFIIVSDKGHEAIRNGWKLSNAYIPKSTTVGGLWHGVEYAKEVTAGEYEHLAIVNNPRYEESRILTPEQFKAYNNEKEIELKRLANSQGEDSMLSFFKKSKVENSADLAGMSVVLPKSKTEVTVEQLVNEGDQYRLDMKLPQMANMDHHVEVGGEKMTLNDFMAKHTAMCQELESLKKPKAEEGEKKENEEKPDEKAPAAKKENEEAPAEKKVVEKKENEETPEEKEKDAKMKNALEEGKKHFEALKDAPLAALKNESEKVYVDKAELGKQKYGSGK